MLIVPGMSIELPRGWQVQATRQPPSVPGRKGNLLVHFATVPLADDLGDFGSGVADTLGPDDVFVSLFEYDPEATAEPLFASVGRPRPRPSEFSPDTMHRPRPGMSGAQWFFTEAGRAFCLYVVLGGHSRRQAGAVRVDALLAGLTIERAS